MAEGKKIAKASARSCLRGIKDEVRAFRKARNDVARDEARDTIVEGVLDVSVSGEWHPGATPEPEEFDILICSGGPAVRVHGRLNAYNQPACAEIQYQHWHTPWMTLNTSPKDDEIILEWASCFYFGAK